MSISFDVCQYKIIKFQSVMYMYSKPKSRFGPLLTVTENFKKARVVVFVNERSGFFLQEVNDTVIISKEMTCPL